MLLSRTLALFLIFQFICLSIHAQIRRERYDVPDGVNIGQDTTSIKRDTNFLLPDTTIVDFFYIDDNRRLHAWTNPSITGNFQQYDIARMQSIDYLHLGNAGSAARPIKYDLSRDIGFDFGYHQYDLYSLNHDSLKYYKLNRPYTNLYFSSGSSQSDFLVKADFSRNYSDGINFSIHYQKINEEGFYQNQKTRSSMFAAGFWHQGKKGKYDGFYSVISNINGEENNGGIQDINIDDPVYSIRQAVPVNLTDAVTRHETREYKITNQFYWSSDSTNRKDLIFQNSNAITSHNYKFSDPISNATIAASYYDPYFLDARGLRQRVSATEFESDNKLNWIITEGFEIIGGLDLSNYRIDFEAEKQSVNNLISHAELRYQFKENLSFNSKIELGLLDNSGDMNLRSELYFLSDKFKMRANMHLKNETPSLIHRRAYINEVQVWDNTFDKVVSLKLGANLHYLPTNTKLSVSQINTTNPVFFNAQNTPSQFDGNMNFLQFQIEQNFSFWKVRSKNTMFYQLIQNNVFQLPEWFTKHSLYLEGFLFKDRMFLNTGIDLRLLPNYFAPAYNPLFGQFIQQANASIRFYPQMDYFVKFEVDTFKIFFKLENLNSFFQTGVYSQIPGNPHFDNRLRFGINWVFKD